MSKATEVKIGPFSGGINLLDKPDQIPNDHAAWILNFDVDNTGTLVPRRNFEYQHVVDASQVRYLLGTAVLDAEQQTRVLVGYLSPTHTNIWALDNPRDTFGNIVAPAEFTVSLAGVYKSVVQYQNKLWYIPGLGSSIGYSSPASLINTTTSVASMPWGDYGFVLKDRMFVVRKATSELYFSKATDFTNWTAPDGGVIKVNPGDNRPITKVVVLNSQIVIFKRDETYILSFTNSPTGDGVLRQVSPDQGAIDAITYNNEIYCFNARSVFKFVNGFFQDIGVQLDLIEVAGFDRTQVSGSGKIHIVGDRLIVGFSTIFAAAMNLNTGAWSMYQVPNALSGVFANASVVGRGSSMGRYVVFGDGRTSLYSMLVERRASEGLPDFNTTYTPQPVKYEFFTKVYDLNDSNVWKRLFSWFADISFPAAVFGRVGFLLDDRTTTHFARRPDGESYINSAGGLIGPTTSSRFKTLQFCYSGTTAPSQRIKVGPMIRYIKAKIGVKANVSQTVTSLV